MIRVLGYYVSRIYIFLGLVEIALLIGAFQLAVKLRFGWHYPADQDGCPLCTSIVFALTIFICLMAMGLYQRGIHHRESGMVVRLTFAFGMGIAILALVFYLVPSVWMGRGVMGIALALAFVAIVLVHETFRRLSGVRSQRRRVLVLGAGAHATLLPRLLDQDPSVGFEIVGFLPLPREQPRVRAAQLLPVGRPLLDLAIDSETDEIVVAADDREQDLPVDELLDCKMSGFVVMDLLSFFEKELALIKIDLLHPSWIIFSCNGFRRGIPGQYGKRVLDIILAAAMLVATAPLLALAAVASLIESRGQAPVLYHQIRIGQDGLPFRLHKLRSMRPDAEADGCARWAAPNDERITRLGQVLRRTRLDEVPQLLNVLKGQMSLVGPRPERPEFVERLSQTIPFYPERHRVKPGVTGWAQLHYRYGSGEEDAKCKLEFDLYYVKNAGIALDLVILLQTVEVVLLGKGAR